MSAAQSVVYLTMDDLYAVVEAITAGQAGAVRDHGLLASAAARPATSIYGEEPYPDLSTKAAALLHSLVTSHPLVDGNKRLALVATRLFYALNDVSIVATEDEKVELILAVEDGTLREVDKIGATLRRWETRSPGQDPH
ncbi:type II toxin-antitoxin system death-on-curing family toxin [Nocardioides ochotonae]|uniref:type II toxin-antitoxin system death-on-curing family toxin n=1 Tax=Nocardioides ochotonae TaxID=2685869 RepID=UPI001CD34CAB|nr:type II toxin-antitoxin system death-on-curing family toxin [Nocardioides ochotonae]